MSNQENDDTQREHLVELRHRRLRRLRELEKMEAILGYGAGAEMRLEIEDIREKVAELEQQILRIGSTTTLERHPVENNTGNHLGHGIRLGGVYNGISLGLVTSAWAHFRNTQVKSGWLYIEGETPSLAAAFFKIHLRDDGTGYVHILGASNPPFTAWLETSIMARVEQAFSWENSQKAPRAVLWQFTWTPND